MKNLAILFSLFTFMSNAQTIDVLVENSTIEISGGTYDVSSSSGQDIDLALIVRNNTGADQEWDLERVLPAMPHWDDWSMSWSLYSSPLIGNDFIVDPVPNWFTQIDIPVPTDDSILMVLRYEPMSDGCDLFKYYILHNDVRVDSFNINICKTVGIEENDSQSISVYPNPTKSELNVTFDNQVPEIVKIHDLLGNEIATFVAEKTMILPIEEFANGIYFLSGEIEGIRFRQKFQVQH